MPSRIKVTKRPQKIAVARKSIPKSGVLKEDPRWLTRNGDNRSCGKGT